MDEFSGKRGIGEMAVPRKGLGLVFTDTANTRDRNGHICSRLGSSSKANPPKVSQVKSSEKGKSLKPSMRSSSSGKELIGGSSRSTTNAGKPLTEPQKTLTSQFETDSSETSSVRYKPEISDLAPLPVKFPRGLQAEDTKTSNAIHTEVGSSSVVPNTRTLRNFNQRRLYQQETERTGPTTAACFSISDVIPDACSSSDSTFNKRKGMIKMRNSEGESSSTVKGKKMEGSNIGSRNGISISDTRGSRNIPSHSDSSRASVRTQRSVGVYARGRFTSQGNENGAETDGSSVTSPPLSDFVDLNVRSLRNQDSSRHFNMDSIAEVLLALERLEQDEELTHEQILLLETNLFLNGLNFHDHHRDMRLDIDNMSYEELLALEERMGSVSTALTEEALSECLKRSVFVSAPSDDAADYFNENNDDIKCCICQEEYVCGDEIGSLQCKHKFHVVCIQEWLQLKSWCPICKESAALPNPSSSH